MLEMAWDGLSPQDSSDWTRSARSALWQVAISSRLQHLRTVGLRLTSCLASPESSWRQSSQRLQREFETLLLCAKCHKIQPKYHAKNDQQYSSRISSGSCDTWIHTFTAQQSLQSFSQQPCWYWNVTPIVALTNATPYRSSRHSLPHRYSTPSEMHGMHHFLVIVTLTKNTTVTLFSAIAKTIKTFTWLSLPHEMWELHQRLCGIYANKSREI